MTVKITYTKQNKKPETIKNVKDVKSGGFYFEVVESNGSKKRYNFKERDYVIV